MLIQFADKCYTFSQLSAYQNNVKCKKKKLKQKAVNQNNLQWSSNLKADRTVQQQKVYDKKLFVLLSVHRQHIFKGTALCRWKHVDESILSMLTGMCRWNKVTKRVRGQLYHFHRKVSRGVLRCLSKLLIMYYQIIYLSWEGKVQTEACWQELANVRVPTECEAANFLDFHRKENRKVIICPIMY